MQLNWFIVKTSAVARWVSVKEAMSLEQKFSNVSIATLTLCGQQPKAKRHDHCIIKYFCIYRQSYGYHNIQHAYRMFS